METCRICQQKNTEEQEVCSNCGYPLTTFPPTLGEIPQAFQEVLSKRETWEKNIWKKYEQLQQQQQELSQNYQQLQQQAADTTQRLQQENAQLKSQLESQNQNQQSQQKILEQLQALLQEKEETAKQYQQLQEQITNLQQENAKLNQKLESQNQSQQRPQKSKNTGVAKVPLLSAVGYDYTRLRDFLAEEKWKEADKETAHAMLRVTGREKEGWLDVGSVQFFPRKDLQTIDSLWRTASNGHFGFSVQKRIYKSLGGTRTYDRELWEKFCSTVGWRQNGKWKEYEELNFTIKGFSPQGHLPTSIRWLELWMGSGVALLSHVYGKFSNIGSYFLTRPDL